MDGLTDFLKPVYSERALLGAYLEEGKELTAKGEKAYLDFDAIQCMFTYDQEMSLMERNERKNIGKGSWKPSKNYPKLMKVQKKVIAHMKQCYNHHHKKSRQMREDQKE